MTREEAQIIIDATDQTIARRFAELVKSLPGPLFNKRRALAELAGVSKTMIFRWESGKNKIPASRLMVFACYFDLPIEYFYEGFENKPS